MIKHFHKPSTASLSPFCRPDGYSFKEEVKEETLLKMIYCSYLDPGLLRSFHGYEYIAEDNNLLGEIMIPLWYEKVSPD